MIENMSEKVEMTITELKNLLGISDVTLKKWKRQGKIKWRMDYVGQRQTSMIDVKSVRNLQEKRREVARLNARIEDNRLDMLDIVLNDS